MTHWRSGLLAAAFALCAAAAPVPHLEMPSPWVTTTNLPAPSDFTYVVQWVLPNGGADPQPADLQYVSVETKPLDEGGLGGYVADTVAGLDATHEVTNTRYGQIETCVRPAWLVSFNASVKGSPRAFEEVYMTFRSTLYLAEYNRPAGQAVEPAAHAALLAFCATIPARRSGS